MGDLKAEITRAEEICREAQRALAAFGEGMRALREAQAAFERGELANDESLRRASRIFATLPRCIASLQGLLSMPTLFAFINAVGPRLPPEGPPS